MKAFRLLGLIAIAVIIASGGDRETMEAAFSFLGLFFIPVFLIAGLVKLFTKSDPS